MSTAELSFERAFERLEQIVEELEQGGLTLDDLLARFEEGMQLSKRCNDCLNAVEKKVEILVRNSAGQLEQQAFEPADE